jgi:hypothetical protein
MKQKMRSLNNFAPCTALMLCLTLAPFPLAAQTTAGQQKTGVQETSLSVKDRAAVAAFEARVKAYAKMREDIEDKMPKLSKDSTPEQIETHEKEFERRVRAARANAKPGQMFTPDIAAFIRATIKSEFKGTERKELRETVLEADTKGVPLRVNNAYPETKELVEMPPTLLLRLPQLPKQLRYRFVNRNMLLVDRENNLIVDFMLDALP